MTQRTRANINAVAPEDQGSIISQLEITVLGQLRDSIGLMNTNITKLADKLDTQNGQVIQLMAAKYDVQIDALRKHVDDEITDQEVRIRDHERQLARLGMGMAISAAVGGSALGAVIVLAVTKILGA